MTRTRRIFGRMLIAFGVMAMALLGTTVANPSPASADPTPQAALVCYDVTYAGPFAGYAHQAASIWNGATNNVDLANCGPNLVIYYTYGGGSYAVVYGLGVGYVVIDYYQALQYNPLRIMTHEIGHILGLADNYNGDCSLLMSGGSAGTGCTNPYPRWDEAAYVDWLFSGTQPDSVGTKVFRDSWPAPAKVAVAN
jgi:snapalysin